MIRPAGHNKNLQVLDIESSGEGYREVNEHLDFIKPHADSTKQVERVLAFKKEFEVDDASVIIEDKTGRYRLPKTSNNYDALQSRGTREIESERYMLNAHGTLYEVGRESGYAAIRPITTHKKRFVDYCTWRGLLVISGTRSDAAKDGHYFPAKNGTAGLWFGAIDDLWKLGKPLGEGGVWKNSAVKAGIPSLPYLMTGYDKKTMTLQSDKEVAITLEIDFDLNGWYQYKTLKLPAGKAVQHVFPDGFSAHWIRAVADKDCNATVWLSYN